MIMSAGLDFGQIIQNFWIKLRLEYETFFKVCSIINLHQNLTMCPKL